MEFADYINPLLKIIALSAVLMIVLFYVKRKTGIQKSHDQLIKVNHIINIGAKEKIAVIEWQKRSILIGITATNISKIDSVDNTLSIEPIEKPTFKQVLATSLTEKNK